MQKFFLLLLSVLPLLASTQPLVTRFELSKGKETPTYEEAISWWKKMGAASPLVQMKETGITDGGEPLHLVMVSRDKDFDIASLKRKKKIIIFINNGIHPGEPDGIDASMLLVRELVDARSLIPENVVLAIIPVYNIGGAKNRSSFYRVDQNGPEEFGFRGNAQNLDLNRDFIKADARETLSFSRIFRMLDPDVFIDNHVSNGADYQHVMTLLTTQHNKLGGRLGTYLQQTMEPALYRTMKVKGWDLVPYVNHFGDTPEKGWTGFWDSPRYSSGYAALWNCFAFVPETHMLKPYVQRVEATRDLMKTFVGFCAENAKQIITLRAEARELQKTQESFPIAWKWDSQVWDSITFKGYASVRKPSEVSGLPRLFYDRSRPYEKKVPYFNTYTDTLRLQKPAAYVLPAGWWKVVERLQANGVQMRRLEKDTQVLAEWYQIENYQSAQRPYEGHRPHSRVQVKSNAHPQVIQKGAWYIPMNQAANRFIMEVLEPQGEDSYFAWNFFDPILAQKEGFSDYVFEETAAEYLKKNPGLKEKLELKKSTDSVFAKNGRAQLQFIYQNSPYFEPAYLRYPVLRVIARRQEP